MLTQLTQTRLKARKTHFAIVASEYNARYVDAMLRAAKKELTRAGAGGIQVVRVPGAFEIPVVAARLASIDPRPAAIICLGVILRGQTTHAEHIGRAVSDSLAFIQVQHGVPVIHEVLLLESEEQAEVRCCSREHNRGREAAQTAVRMGRVMASLTPARA